MLIDHWPLFGLRVTSPRLELRLPTGDELAEVADLAARGIHPPHTRPFLSPWGELPPAERARHVVRMHWRRLGRWTPQDWALELVAFHEGRPVGVQDVRAEEFGVRREVVSGSWVGLEHQGAGFGTEMRAAMLHLLFAELGGQWARSVSFSDNAPSLAVSRRLGYREDGIDRDVLDGRVVESVRLRLSREDWERHATVPVTVSGLTDGCREMLGATPTPTSTPTV
ncbi:GNAT family N-acetyltransferase [Kitasatospora sp. NPDC059577]|uniref:GNAT family N-acetyltransferase n=1 Tax=Kitasatospora sp. NPDC059577 TaxID=3346873 RepID=UPI0036CA3EEE